MTQGGQAILKLRLATTETYLDRNQARQERTEWHQVTLWGKRGEALSKFLTKGDRLFVEGRISTSSYEKDGEKRYRTEIVATNIILGGRGKGAGGGDEIGGGGGGGGYQRREAPARAPAPAQNAPAARDRDPGPPPDDFGDYAGGSDDDIPF